MLKKFRELSLPRKILYIAALAFIILSTICSVSDSRYEKNKLNGIKAYPVITEKEMNQYKNEQQVSVYVVENIHLAGKHVTDPMEKLMGEYLYVDVDVQRYHEKQEDSGEEPSGWVTEENHQANAAHIKVKDTECEITLDQIYGMDDYNMTVKGRMATNQENENTIDHTYYLNGNTEDYEGNIRYSYQFLDGIY